MEVTGKKLRYVIETIVEVDVDSPYEMISVVEDLLSQGNEYGECRVAKVEVVEPL